MAILNNQRVFPTSDIRIMISTVTRHLFSRREGGHMEPREQS